MGSYIVNAVQNLSGTYNIFLFLGITSLNQLLLLNMFLINAISVSTLLAYLNKLNLDSILLWTSLYNCSGRINYTSKALTNFLLLVVESSALRLNMHIGPLFGVTSLLWSGHITHSTIQVYRGLSPTLFLSPTLGSILDKDNHIWGSSYGSGNSILTFI
jgi:hypothetical protein